MPNKINVKTLAADSSKTLTDSIEFAGELTELDTTFADAAILKFKYSDSIDGSTGELINPQHEIKDDVGLWDLGSVANLKTGLDSDTKYYYKVVGETVTYDSPASIENAIASEGFMNDLINNNTEFKKAINRIPILTKILTSLYADSVWSSNDPSEAIWDVGTFDGSGGSGDWEITLDLTNVTSLKIKTKYDAGAPDLVILVGGNREFSTGETNSSWTERVIDVSNYSGETKITLSLRSYNDYYKLSKVAGPTGGKAIKLDLADYGEYCYFGDLILE